MKFLTVDQKSELVAKHPNISLTKNFCNPSVSSFDFMRIRNLNIIRDLTVNND